MKISKSLILADVEAGDLPKQKKRIAAYSEALKKAYMDIRR